MIDKSKFRIKEEVNGVGKTVYYIQEKYFGLFWGPMIGEHFAFPWKSFVNAKEALLDYIELENSKKAKPKYHHLNDEDTL
jgi:hypothetical protein